MDQHFSIDIAKYSKSTSILVGFNLYQPLEEHGIIYKKIFGTIVSHPEPEVKDGQPYISSFDIIINWNKELHRNAQSEEEKKRYISTIDTENISSYEVATVKAVIPKWSKASSVLKTR